VKLKSFWSFRDNVVISDINNELKEWTSFSQMYPVYSYLTYAGSKRDNPVLAVDIVTILLDQWAARVSLKRVKGKLLSKLIVEFDQQSMIIISELRLITFEECIIFSFFCADIFAPKNFKPKTQLCDFWHQNFI
jgi:hypothetical protein